MKVPMDSFGNGPFDRYVDSSKFDLRRGVGVDQEGDLTAWGTT